MEKIIGITEARTTIKNLVDRVSEQNETYIIAQDSKPQAVIISYDEYIRNRTIIEVNKKLRFEKVLEEKTVVVLDTNILISAVLFKGTPLKILQLCVSKNKIDVAISLELLAEFIGKLKYKFGIKNQTLESLKTELESSMIYVLPEYTTQICRDTSDNKIIDLAIYASADFIITSDKDLLEIKTYKEIKILTAVEFIEI